MKFVVLIFSFCIYSSGSLFAQSQKINQLEKTVPLIIAKFAYIYSFSTTHYTKFTVRKDSTFYETYENNYKTIHYKMVAIKTPKEDWESLVKIFNFVDFENLGSAKPIDTHLGGKYTETFVVETNYGKKEIENTNYRRHHLTMVKPFIENLKQLIAFYSKKYPGELIKKFE